MMTEKYIQVIRGYAEDEKIRLCPECFEERQKDQSKYVLVPNSIAQTACDGCGQSVEA